jgi:hypothetical protein
MSKSNGTQEIDTSNWMRREEVAKKLGVSLPALTRLQAKEKLNPIVVEGVNFYDPEEVGEVFIEKQRERETLEKGPSKGSVEAYVYESIRAMVGLVKEPREKIDVIQFDIIKDLRAELKEARAELKTARTDIEAARDQTLERGLAIKQVESDGRIKEMAATRIVATLGKLINGPEGVALTPPQLKQLLDANADPETGATFLSPEQEKQARGIVAAHEAKTNGKGAVSAVASAVKTATETMKANDQG